MSNLTGECSQAIRCAAEKPNWVETPEVSGNGRSAPKGAVASKEAEVSRNGCESGNRLSAQKWVSAFEWDVESERAHHLQALIDSGKTHFAIEKTKRVERRNTHWWNMKIVPRERRAVPVKVEKVENSHHIIALNRSEGGFSSPLKRTVRYPKNMYLVLEDEEVPQIQSECGFDWFGCFRKQKRTTAAEKWALSARSQAVQDVDRKVLRPTPAQLSERVLRSPIGRWFSKFNCCTKKVATEQGMFSDLSASFVVSVKNVVLDALSGHVAKQYAWKVPALASSIAGFLLSAISVARSSGGKMWMFSSLLMQMVSIVTQIADFVNAEIDVDALTKAVLQSFEVHDSQEETVVAPADDGKSDYFINSVISLGDRSEFSRLLAVLEDRDQRARAIEKWNSAWPLLAFVNPPASLTCAPSDSPVEKLRLFYPKPVMFEHAHKVIHRVFNRESLIELFPFIIYDQEKELQAYLASLDPEYEFDVADLLVFSLSDFVKENLELYVNSLSKYQQEVNSFNTLEECDNFLKSFMMELHFVAPPLDLIISRKVILQMDTSKLVESFKNFSVAKLLSVIVMSIVSFIAGKCHGEKGVMKAFSKGLQHLNSMPKTLTTLQSLSDWIGSNFFGEDTVEDTLRKQYIDLSDKLQAALIKQDHEYYRDLTQLDAFNQLIIRAGDMLSHHTSHAKAAFDILSGTLVAAKKRYTDILHGLKSNQSRIVPVVVYLFGREGVGKTTGVEYFVSKVAESCKLKKDVYNFKGSKYWPVYNMQQMAHFEEMFAEKTLVGNSVYENFNSIISSAPFLMEGAAVEHKEMPCNFHFLFITSNVHPREIKKLMPVSPSAIPSVYSRMLFYECVYNQGPDEELKPREDRKRLPDLGHINFVKYEYMPNQSDKCCEAVGDFLNAADVIKECVDRYSVNCENLMRITRIGKEQGSRCETKFSVVLHGPAGAGKTVLADQIGAALKSAYGMSRFDHTLGGVTNNESGYHVFDDFIKMTSPHADERDFMNQWNNVENPSLVLSCTNVSPKHKLKMNSFVDVASSKKVYRKISRLPFSEAGTARRMGYAGEIQVGKERMYCDNTCEIHVVDKVYMSREKNMLVAQAVEYVLAEYRKFLVRSQQVVVREVNYLEYGDKSTIEIRGDSRILQDLTSRASLIKMVMGTTANGSQIVVPAKLADAFSRIPVDRLIPTASLEYNRECLIALAQHFSKIFSTMNIDAALSVHLEGLPSIYAEGGFVQVVGSGDVGVTLRRYTVDGLVTYHYGAELFDINVIDLYFDMNRDVFPVAQYSKYPVPVMVVARQDARELPTGRLALVPAYNERRKAAMRKVVADKAVTYLGVIKRFWEEHKFLMVICSTLMGLVALSAIIIKTCGVSKKTFAKKYLVAIATDKIMGTDSRRKYQEQFASLRFESKLKVLEEANLKHGLKPVSAAEQKKGSGSKIKRSWSRKKVLSNGDIMYFDDNGDLMHMEYSNPSKTRKFDNLFEASYEYDHDDSDDDDDDHMSPSAWNARYGLQGKDRSITAKPKQQSLDVKMWKPYNDSESPFAPIRKQIYRNMVYLCNSCVADESQETTALDGCATCMFGLGLRGRYVLAPRHILRCQANGMYVRENVVKSIWIADGTADKQLCFRADVRAISARSDLCIFEIVSKRFPEFVDITKHFVDEQTCPTTFSTCLYKPGDVPRTAAGDLDFSICGPLDSGWAGKFMYDTEQLLYGNAELRLDEEVRFTSGDVVRTGDVYYGMCTTQLTTEGTCGLPYFRNTKNTAGGIICGVHIGCMGGGSEVFTSIFSFVSKQDLADLFSSFDSVKVVAPQARHQMQDYCNGFVENLMTTSKANVQAGAKPDIPFAGGSSVAVVGALTRTRDHAPVSPYIRTQFSKYVSNIVPVLTAPVELRVERLSAQQRNELSSNALGAPCQRVTQELMWEHDDHESLPDDLADVVVDELAAYYSVVLPELRILTESEALSGCKFGPYKNLEALELDVSPGFELMEQFPVTTLSDLMMKWDGEVLYKECEAAKYLEEQVRMDFENAKHGNVPVFVYKNCMKMEKRPVAKTHKGRLFTVACKRQVIFERRVLGAFYAGMCKNDHVSCRVGMDSMTGFEFMYQNARLVGSQCMNVDYKRYDKSIPSICFIILTRILTKLYQLGNKVNSGYTNKQLEYLITAAITNCYRSLHVSGTTVYVKRVGMCSGCPGTAVLNSVVNDIMNYAVWVHIAEKRGVPYDYRSYRERVLDFTYGDDLVKVFADEILPYYNPATITKNLRELFGVSAESADKDGSDAALVSIDKMQLCSRTVVRLPNSDLHVGGLKPESISGMIHWTKSDDPAQLAAQLSVAYLEESLISNDSARQMLRLVRIAISRVPQLSTMLTIPSRGVLIREVANNMRGMKQSVVSRNLQDVIVQEHFIVPQSNATTTMDYISALNRMWQEKKISVPEYSADGSTVTCTRLSDHLMITGRAKGGFNKAERKRLAAKSAYDQVVANAQGKRRAVEQARTYSLIAMAFNSAFNVLQMNVGDGVSATPSSSNTTPKADNASRSASGASSTGGNNNALASDDLAAGVAPAPSMIVNPGGTISGTGVQAAGELALNPGNSAPYSPEFGGRPMDVEAILWNQLMPLSDGSITSASEAGAEVFRFRPDPQFPTETHRTFVSMFEQGNFAGMFRFLLFGASDIAGSLIFGWVPDINKTTFSVAELMTYNYRIVDISQTHSMDVLVEDARRIGVFRKIPYDSTTDPDPLPGIVCLVYSQLNNKFATSDTYTINYSILYRFADTMALNAPVLTPSTKIQNTFQPVGEPLNRRFQPFSLSSLTSCVCDLFVGGSTAYVYDKSGADLIETPHNRNTLGVGADMSPEAATTFGSLTAFVTGAVSNLKTALGTVVQQNIVGMTHPDGGDDNFGKSYYTISTTWAVADWEVVSPDVLITALPGQNFSNYYIHDMSGDDKLTALVQQYNTTPFECLPLSDSHLTWTNPSSGGKTFHTTEKEFSIQIPDKPYAREGKVASSAVVLGDVVTGLDSITLAGGSKRFDLIVPGQTAAVERQNYYPAQSTVGAELQSIFESWCAVEGVNACVFNLSNISGVLAVVGFIPGVGFQVVSSVSNRLLAGVSSKTLSITNIRKVAAISSLPPTDTSAYIPFITSSGSRVTKRRPTHQMMAVGGISSALGGLFNGISSWQQQQNNNKQAELDRNLQQNLASGGWQNSLDVVGAQGKNQLRLTDAQGLNSRRLEQLKADLSLRNAGLMSSSNLNRATPGNPANSRQKVDWSKPDIFSANVPVSSAQNSFNRSNPSRIAIRGTKGAFGSSQA